MSSRPATVRAPKGHVEFIIPSDIGANVDLYEAIKHLSLAQVLVIAGTKLAK